MSQAMTSICSDYRRMARSWDPRFVRHFRWFGGARDPAGIIERNSRPGKAWVPFWLLLPEWIADFYRRDRSGRRLSPRFLRDILWAQYSLFLVIKIQDELFDRQVSRLSLLWVADEFFLEAQRVFQLHFETRSPFWDFYFRAVRTTVRAIDRVDHEQSLKNASYQSIVGSYPAMYEICKIATYALCLKAGRTDHLPGIWRFFDEMTAVGQTVDDFEDLVEDLHRGRRNAAAAFLHRRGRTGRDGYNEGVLRGLLYTDAAEELFVSFRRRVARAEDSIRFLKRPDAREFMESYKTSLERAEDQLHRRRVEQIFGRYAG